MNVKLTAGGLVTNKKDANSTINLHLSTTAKSSYGNDTSSHFIQNPPLLAPNTA